MGRGINGHSAVAESVWNLAKLYWHRQQGCPLVRCHGQLLDSINAISLVHNENTGYAWKAHKNNLVASSPENFPEGLFVL